MIPETDIIVLVGEIGGTMRRRSAWIHSWASNQTAV